MEKAPFSALQSAADRTLDLSSQFVSVRGVTGDVQTEFSNDIAKFVHGIDLSTPKL